MRRPFGYLRDFLQTESASGVLLLVSATVALAWVNVAPPSYASLWSSPFHVDLPGVDLHLTLREWISDGAMSLFFFVVGLEIKRELVDGELRGRRRAALPLITALGGMILPALIYISLTRDTHAVRGWGIPMATDIAFAVGVLSLLGSRVPSGLKVFLLSVAIVDDIGAIAVIAFFYSGPIALASIVAAMFMLVSFRLGWLLRFGRARSLLLILVAVATWLFVHASGVHATIAGVALAALVPASGEDPSAAERVGHRLHRLSSFVIVPLFALANAGVVLTSDAFGDPAALATCLGVLLGLVIGKFIGITGSAYLATRVRVATLPDDVSWRQIAGAGALGGIGFTVSLFITELAFAESDSARAAKIGIIAASVIASAFGALLLASNAEKVRIAPSAELDSSDD